MSTDTETTRRSFLGLDVVGEINEGEKRADQKPLWELEPFLRALIDDPEIHSFGWTQYTPYFNDGEPCTFGVGASWFVTMDDPSVAAAPPSEPGDEDEGEYREGHGVDYGDHPTLGRREYTWSRDAVTGESVRIWGAYTGTQEARYDRARAFSDALDSGAFEDVLLEAFGDHCMVVYSRAKNSFVVDEYSHD